MVEVGEEAPTFTAPVVTDEIESFALEERLDEAPLILAFFPAAFTSTCQAEMDAFEDRLSSFEEVGASIYGVSVDSPFALQEWREKRDLSFGLISDFEKEIIEDFGVRTDFSDLGVYGLAQRAVFVVDGEGTVTYRWVAEHAGLEPDYDEVERAAERAAEVAVE